MSVNDLLDSETLIPIMMIIFLLIMIFAIPTGMALSKNVNNNIYGDGENEDTKEEKNAKIVARRSTPHPYNQTVLINKVVFELEDGSRVELAIKDPNTYGIMVEGDCGKLTYQGKKFIGFERGDNNEA